VKNFGGRPATRIQSVSRAIDVLRVVAAAPEGGLAVTEIARALGRPIASVHHLLNTLTDEGMLAKDAARRYHLGPTVGSLGRAQSRLTQPPPLFLERLRQLSEVTGESAYFSSWRHGEIAVLASVEGTHPARVSELQRGYAGNAHARASGKLLLAYLEPDELQRYLATHPLAAVTSHTITSRPRLLAQLDQVRELGYATDIGEFKEGVACVSGPARHEGTVVGAFTVTSPLARFLRRRRQLVDSVILIAGTAAAVPAFARRRPPNQDAEPTRSRRVPVKKENDER